MRPSIQAASDLVSNLVGLPGWGFRPGFSTFITMEFGELNNTKIAVTEKSHGAWRLWVEMASWRFIQNGVVILGSDDEDEKKVSTLDLLSAGGQSVHGVKISELQPDLTIDFLGGIQFQALVTSSSSRDRVWTLYFPNKMALTIYSDGHYTLGP